MGVSYRKLHIITQQMWVRFFINKKARFIDYTVYIYPYRYMWEVGVPHGGCVPFTVKFDKVTMVLRILTYNEVKTK
jgi:hypothetical protein